jgi:hypothetical protein
MSSSYRDEHLNYLNPPNSSPIAVGDSYLLDPPGTNSQIGSASGSFQNDGFLGCLDGGSSGSDAEFGFLRPEFRQNPLVGTVDYYERHVFLCYKNPQVWPPRIEAAEFDRLPRLLSAALNARKADIRKQTRLTICEGHDGTETSNGDILIFPDMIRYRRLTHFDVETFVEEVLVKDGEWLPGTAEALKGSYAFVCAHGTRDRRCGVCGPAIINRFKEEIENNNLQGKVSVRPCSHIGGHKYAGNVIVFGSSITGEVTGHWYGYVMPEDVPGLLEQHIEKGKIVDWLWRGQMGLSEEEQRKAQELRLEANGGTHISRIRTTTQVKEEPAQTTDIITNNTECASHLQVNGCCQTNGTTSASTSTPCCQSLTKCNDDKSKKSSKKQTMRKNSVRKVCAMPTWFDSWEHEDTYAVVAVLSAAASISVAYSCFKQLR